jgi:DNA-binding transcriptional regulator YdaS (Cro superfamily)
MNDRFQQYVKNAGGPSAVAKRLGVSVESIQKWASGERRPRPEQALAIEQLTGGAIPKERWYWAA